MIDLLHIPQTRRFAAQLRFSGQQRPELLEIDHHPELDPPRKWTFQSRGGGKTPTHCEVKLHGPDGGITFDLIYQPGPIVVIVNKTGLIITTNGR